MTHYTNDSDPGGVQAQEDGNSAACYRAAAAHGLTAEQADECAGGDKACPQCPFSVSNSRNAA